MKIVINLIKNASLACLMICSIIVGTSTDSFAQFRSGQVIFINYSPSVTTNDYIATEGYATTRGALLKVKNYKRFLRRHVSSFKWKLESAGGGYFFLKQLSSNKVMDVKGGNSRAGTPVWIYPKNGTDAQKFKLTSVRNGNFVIIPKLNPSLRLTVENGAIKINTNRNRSNQRFKITTNLNTFSRYKIELISLKCVEEDDPGSEIEIYGKISARINNVNTQLLWRREERNPFEMDEGELYNQRDKSTTFRAAQADIDAGKYTVKIIIDLWEDDGSSGDDKLRIDTRGSSYNHNHWSISDGLGTIKRIAFVEGDTVIEMQWKVTKY